MSGNKECLVCSTPCKRTEIIDGNNRKYKLKTKFESITNIDLTKYPGALLCDKCFTTLNNIVNLKRGAIKYSKDWKTAKENGRELPTPRLCIVCEEYEEDLRKNNEMVKTDPGKLHDRIQDITGIDLKGNYKMCTTCIGSLEEASIFMRDAKTKEKLIPQLDSSSSSGSSIEVVD